MPLTWMAIRAALAVACLGCGLGSLGCAGGSPETQASAGQFALAATVAAASTSISRSGPSPSAPRSSTVAGTAAPRSDQGTATAPASTATREPAMPSPTRARDTSVPTPLPHSTASATQEPAPPAQPPADPPAAQPVKAREMKFQHLYSGASITGPILSDLAKSLHGQRVSMAGFMAPPLKPDVDFFVLTQTPMVYCPFCNTAADWPFDIVFVRMAGGKTMPAVVPSQGIRVTGTFSVGTDTDQATGFVSLVRIYADSVETLR